MDSTEIEEKLQLLQCPINWNLEEINKGNATKKLLRRSETTLEKGDSSSTWQKISIFLCIAFIEHSLSSEEGEDENKMSDHLKHVEEICEKGAEIYPFIKEYSKSVFYVVNAMWAHFYQKENDIQEVKKYLQQLTAFDELKPTEKAGILAIKSCCFMAFGPHDDSEALKAIEKALEMDNNQAEWHFLKGKCLARTRRSLRFRSSPTDEELECLAKVLEKGTKCASHYVFCALSIQERGLNDNSAEKKNYMEKSHNLFLQAAAYSFHSPTSLARIARGLMRTLYWPRQGPSPNEELIESCVKRAGQLCPQSGLVNHVAGDFYIKTARGRKPRIEKGIGFLKKAAFECGVFGAYANLFDIYYTHKTLINMDETIEKFWEEFKEVPVDRFKALKSMAAYYFYLKKDYLRAVQYWKEWLNSQNTEKDHKNKFFHKCDNLTQAISDKIRKELGDNASLTPEEKDEFQIFLDTVDGISS